MSRDEKNKKPIATNRLEIECHGIEFRKSMPVAHLIHFE
jgi:hypothetical protein